MRRVLPVPPVPMRVTSRWRSMSAASSVELLAPGRRSSSAGRGRFERRVLSERSGREVPRQVVDHHLVDLLRSVHVAQAVRSPRSTRSTDAGSAVAGQDGRDGGADDLAAVRDRQDPRHSVERRYRSSRRRGPRRRRRGAPSGRAAGRSRPRSRARRARCAASAASTAATGSAKTASIPSPVVLIDRAAARLDALAQERVVLGERRAHRPRVLLPQARASLDVREEEGRNRAGGAGRRFVGGRTEGLHRHANPATQSGTGRIGGDVDVHRGSPPVALGTRHAARCYCQTAPGARRRIAPVRRPRCRAISVGAPRRHNPPHAGRIDVR